MELSEEEGMKNEIDHRLLEGKSALGGSWNVWREGNMGMGLMRRVFESVVIPKVMYGCETWVLSANYVHRLGVFEMKGLRSMCGVSVRDRVRNARIREWCGWDKSIISRYEQGILRWYGHVLRMDGGRLARRVFEDVVTGVRGMGRPKRRWMDGVKDVLGMRGVGGEGRELAMDRLRWRGVVYGTGGGP